MRWIVLNVLGALAWVVGIVYVKGEVIPNGSLLDGGDHRLLIGMTFGLLGLVLLLWVNLRSTA